MKEIEEIKELKERYERYKMNYKMNIEKLKSILEKKHIIERIVDVYEKTLMIMTGCEKKEELEKILIYEIPKLKKDLLFLMRLLDIQASLIKSLLVIYKQDKKLIEELFSVNS